MEGASKSTEPRTPFSFPPPFVRIIAVLVVLVGLIAVFGRVWGGSSSVVTRNDFTQDYVSAKAWRLGQNPYDTIPNLTRRYIGQKAEPGIGPGQVNPHVPAEILLVSPLSELPYRAARAIWLLLVAASIAVAVGIVARLSGLSSRTSAIVGIGSLAVPVSQTYLQLVQADGLCLLLVALGWLALKRRRDSWAGASLGVAAAQKLFPGIMLLVLLRYRRYRAALWLVWTWTVLTAGSALAIGPTNLHTFLTIASPHNFRLWRGSPLNISLLGIPYRWLTNNPWRVGGINVPLLAAGVVGILFVAAIICVFRTPASATGDSYWAVIPIMLLVSPLSWEFSLIYMLPVVLLWVLRMARGTLRPHPIALIALAILIIGLIPGLHGAVIGGASTLSFLPYLIPTAALLFVVLSDLRTRDSNELTTATLR